MVDRNRLLEKGAEMGGVRILSTAFLTLLMMVVGVIKI